MERVVQRKSDFKVKGDTSCWIAKIMEVGLAGRPGVSGSREGRFRSIVSSEDQCLKARCRKC